MSELTRPVTRPSLWVGAIFLSVAPAFTSAGVIESSLQSINGSDVRSINGSDALSINGSDVLSINGSDALSINGSDALSINGSDALSINGSDVLSINGSDALSINGSDVLSINGSDALSINGSDVLSINGSDVLSINGSDALSINGSDALSINGSDALSINGSDVLSINGSDALSINGSDVQSINGSDVLFVSLDGFSARYADLTSKVGAGGAYAIGLQSGLLAVAPVASVDYGRSIVNVLGGQVTIASSHLGTLGQGDLVAVFGGQTLNGVSVATSLVKLSDAAPSPSADVFVQGTVGAVDARLGRIVVGGVAFDYTPLMSSGMMPTVGAQIALVGTKYAGSPVIVAK